MAGFLHSDSRFTMAVRQVMFFALVNIFWLLCCIPVLTIGLSTTAMFTCLNAYGATGDLDSWKAFFPALKKNWKQGLVLELLVVLAAVLLTASAVSVRVTDIGAKPLFWAVLALAGVGLASVAVYGFPLLAQFDNTTVEFVRISCIIGFRYLISTVFLLIYGAAVIFLCAMVLYLLPFWIFGGFAAAAGLINRLYHRIFLLYGAPQWDKTAQNNPQEPESR